MAEPMDFTRLQPQSIENCPKCGAGAGLFRKSWHKASDKMPEYMGVTCTCGFYWFEEPLDRQQPVQGVK